jgi:ABC-2 type transport system ATP-binding protein
VLSSHLLTEVEQVCDRVGVIREGQLVAQGSVDQLRGAQAVHIVADPLDRARRLLLEHPDIDDVRVAGRTLIVDGPERATAELNRRLVAADIAVSHLSVQRRALEDVFLDMTTSSAVGRPPNDATTTEGPGDTSPGMTSDGPGGSSTPPSPTAREAS